MGMKKSVLVLAAIAVILQGCAGSVKSEGQGTRELLKDSKMLSIGSDKCPRGIGVIRLYKDTLDGNITRFNAKMALTSKPISGKFNVYNLLDENNEALLQKGERKQAKADVDTSSNSIVVKLSSEVIKASAKMSDGTKMLKASSGEEVKPNKDFAIRYNPKTKYYENNGIVASAVLSELDADIADSVVLHSGAIKLNGKLTNFAIPTSIEIDDEAKKLDKAVSGEVGKPITLSVAPTDTPGMIYVQFNNYQKGKANATYNYIIDETPGVGEIAVPTDGMKEGEYVMNVFRSQIKQIPADDSGQTFCMEVGTGVRGRATISKPAKK